MAHIGDFLAAHLDEIIAVADRHAKPSMGGIKFEKKRRGVRRRQIIDRNDAEVTARCFQKRAEHIPPDPAKAIDGNLFH